MTKKLTIIIVSYNSSEIIQESLRALITSKKYRVLIVDNASPDGSGEKLSKAFPHIELLRLDENLGYGRGANVGLMQTHTPYALLLNPDLRVSTDDIEKLLTHAESDNEKAAIWGPAVKKTDFTGDSPKPVKWISGCAMLFDTEKLKHVGLFDEHIFLFFEETDLCHRIIQSGYEIKHCKDVFFDHLVGKSSPPNPKIDLLKNWHFGWSRSYFFDKHGLATGKKNPFRRYLTYRLKSLLAFKRSKRNRLYASALGTRSFIKGKKAFSLSGPPFNPSDDPQV